MGGTGCRTAEAQLHSDLLPSSRALSLDGLAAGPCGQRPPVFDHRVQELVCRARVVEFWPATVRPLVPIGIVDWKPRRCSPGARTG